MVVWVELKMQLDDVLTSCQKDTQLMPVTGVDEQEDYVCGGWSKATVIDIVTESGT